MRPFLYLFGGFVVVGAWLQVAFNKYALLLFVNGHYTSFLDSVMPWWTDFGLGGTHVFLIFLLFGYAWFRRDRFTAVRWGWLSLLSFALPSLLSQLLKHTIFDNVLRPSNDMVGGTLHFVPGVEMYGYNSFPSGHTITAFSIALTLVYLFVQPAARRGAVATWAWSPLLFLWACSVGYSRMYLGEHFFADVYGGAIIGVLATGFALWLGERTLPYKPRASR